MKFVPIPFDWMRRHTVGAVRQGVPFDSLMANSRIELRYGDRRDVVSPVQCLLLCMNTVLAVEDATHGLGRARVGAIYPAVGLRMAMGCANLGGALEALGRLYASVSSAVHIQVTTAGEWASLRVHMEAVDEADAVYLEENYLLWMFQHCLYFLGRAPPVRAVTVRDPAHFNLGRAHWGIGGLVGYGDVTAFSFPRRLLAAPPAGRGGGNVMWESQERWLASIDDGLASSLDYVSGGRFVRFADLVRESGRSANTVRRRWQAAGGAFRAARARALIEAASARLTASDDSVETIAVELGYSDARSFRRFLKSATGLTPQELRDHGGVGASEHELGALVRLKALCDALNI